MPILSAKALCDHTLSTLTPSTSASSWSNFFMSFTKQACSLVQVGLQSSGYQTSTTFLFPAKSDSFTSFFSWFNSVKSGAACPTAMLMILPPGVRKLSCPSYRISQLRPTAAPSLNLCLSLIGGCVVDDFAADKSFQCTNRKNLGRRDFRDVLRDDG